MSGSSLLDLATRQHRAGDLADARRLYLQALAVAPADAETCFRAGLLELQDGHADRALPLIERAAAVDPADPRHDVGLGQVLYALGRFDAAAAAYRRALRADAGSADVQFALGLALQSGGDHPAAIAAYELALAADPAHFAALNNLGNCLQRSARPAAAADAYTRALALRPREAGALANLGSVLGELGRDAEAVRMLRAAVALAPAVPAHQVNLGIALCRTRDFAAAETVLRAAQALAPDAAEAAFNLGNALNGQGLGREAGTCFRRALALQPDHADALINLGNLHRQLGEFADAAAAYEAALRAQPGSVAALNNAACLQRTLGRFDAAEDLLRQALERQPAHPALHDNLGSVYKDAGDLDAAIACFRRSLELDPANPATHGNLVYALSFQSATAAPILEESRRWHRRFAEPLERAAQPAHGGGIGGGIGSGSGGGGGGGGRDLRPGRRLRVGYVSPDFREHCQSLFTVPLLANHDPDAVEIHCYSGVERPDSLTHRLAALAHAWREVRALDDAALADLIRRDRIDILVDLTMHMANGRLLTFARRPAPVQIAWLAYPGTTGLDGMDYRISDARLDPAAADGDYAERTLRLPDSFWCYDPLSAGPAVGPLPALARGHLTFGCLNNPCKLTDATLRLWSGVMQALPSARLVLLAPAGRHGARLAARLAAHGISPGRVEFAPHRSREAYLRAYHDIDLCLDTIPYNGHTTSLDALWMGVPTVSRVGGTCVGRGGLSQLTQVGLGELAATSDAGFVAAVVRLARDLPELARLRAALRARLERSALMDGPRFARHLERLYRHAWEVYCASEAAPA